MRKILLIVILITLLVFVGCDKTKVLDAKSSPQDVTKTQGETESVDNKTDNIVEKNNNVSENPSNKEVIKDSEESESVSNTLKEEINNDNSDGDAQNDESNGQTINNLDEPVFIKTIKTFSSHPEFNEEKINEAIDMGFTSPIADLDVYSYSPRNSDVISYNSQNSSFQLLNSMTHKGFKELVVCYEKKLYMWSDFFGELDFSEYSRNITVKLKGESIYEEEIADEYEKYFRYYNEDKGIYYEIQDLMMGNFTDPDAILTRKQIGMACSNKKLEGLVNPTYNPFVLENKEQALDCCITVLDGKPCVYVETKKDEKLFQKWISIEAGVVVKQLSFDNEGLIIEEKVATSINKQPIDNSVFNEPSDVDYKDISLFIYSAEGGDIETLKMAVQNTIPETKTGILLTSNSDETKTIYTKGMDKMKLSKAMYVYKSKKADGGEISIRAIEDDGFVTICDELKTIEIYEKSCFEEKFFNFVDVGLLSVKSTENGKIYTFYDTNNISVSSLYSIYEYVVEDNKISRINVYKLESLSSDEKIGEEISYTVELIKFDESVYDDSCLNTYKIIDHGKGSINDGEHMPFWMN